MILTGRAVSAAEAVAIGLANRVVPAGQALAAAQELAAQLASFPQVCLRSDRASVLDQEGLDEAARPGIGVRARAASADERGGRLRCRPVLGRRRPARVLRRLTAVAPNPGGCSRRRSENPPMPKVVRCASTDLCADAPPPISAGDPPIRPGQDTQPICGSQAGCRSTRRYDQQLWLRMTSGSGSLRWPSESRPTSRNPS